MGRIAQGGNGTVVEAEASNSGAHSGTDPEQYPAPGQLIKRADLHCDQAGMVLVGVDDADPEADALGLKRTGRDRRQDGAM